ncbi:LysR family transcriptional regulator [Acuticoccus mangrovi]|uniref:LysR family transcriptional regulator n=1 Tax=Acuticoccus mangrovi TaxID=2796142 RepID=A0A934IDE6_9HYPH|nr:LysR substrate-binding domain-containing protein [Acuticoccus mangrovi]MBJ3774499.1 LysR family transcriptional regulator [Acuticoccus mangrovi]
MEIKQLRYFKRVADAGSVSRAAAALSVAQPAVSRQVANLEEALGTPLFFRNGRGVKLTDAGEQLYGHVGEILEAIRQAEQDVRDSMGVARGTILIGSTPTVIRYLAPPLLARIGRSHPELELEFTEGLSGYVNEWLSNGLLDIAVLHDATRTQHFLTEPLVREELVFVGTAQSGADPIRFRDVTTHPLILPRRNHGLRLLVERVAGHYRLALDVRAEIDSLAAIKTLVREGVASTMLPRGALTPEDGLIGQPIVDPPVARTLLLSTSSQRPVSQSTRAVIHELKMVVREFLSGEGWPGLQRYVEGAGHLPPVEPANDAKPGSAGLGHAA